MIKITEPNERNELAALSQALEHWNDADRRRRCLQQADDYSEFPGLHCDRHPVTPTYDREFIKALRSIHAPGMDLTADGPLGAGQRNN